MISTLSGVAVRRDVAMTGEVTLRGRVLPIGGLKEKLLAALRGGITTVLIPAENEKDLAEIPASVKEGLEIIPVEHGITPDLFREGSGVVAEGKLMPQRLFVADNILAKHDERYMPPELGNLAAEHKAGKTLQK